jgi:hypothetical protein
MTDTVHEKVWMYWEGAMPPYISLCMESIEKNCGLPTQIVDLGNLYSFLPKIRKDLSKLREVAHRADYIRGCLLRAYGCIWVDCDLICFKSLRPLLDEANVSGLACSGIERGKPSIWFLASTLGGVQVTQWVEAMDRLMDAKGIDAPFGWNDFGSLMLAPIISTSGYHHIDRALFGWIPWNQPEMLFRENAPRLSAFDGYGFVLFNKMIGPALSGLPKDAIYRSNTLLGQLLRRALES